MQIELPNRKKWKTRIELSNAIFEYIEILHNRHRRHSSLGYRTPIEYELLSEQNLAPPSGSPTQTMRHVSIAMGRSAVGSA